MTATVKSLPIWKRGASAAERLDELAQMAREHPERFEKFILVYHETLADKKVKVRVISFSAAFAGSELSAVETMGLLSLGQHQEFEGWVRP